ncbi:uncharacterized protein [Misgurnus anguillicaudatus]|uniref:uncharacterized protein isoform X1 n=2 Tax=Misgurnus anguillicaudatus TaxID=75329 RepID=UPI003CCF553A
MRLSDILSFLPTTASDIVPLRTMLQQNNNNNHPCLDMTHREILHDYRRPSVSFTSAIEFGAIPLIKGLRAWAVSGGYSKTRRKGAAGPRAQGTCQQPHESRVGQTGWSGQVSNGYAQTLESTASTARTPGIRQGGPGALVTVATLKGTEGGGRQTQTRCLFLKAQERGNYICAVGNRGAGTRIHTVILDGAKEEGRCSSRGPRVNQDGTDEGGTLRPKPRAIRKWRKCSKGSAQKQKTSQGKAKITHPPCEQGRDDAVILEEPINRTSDNTTADRITQCQTDENKMEDSSTSYSGLIEQQSPELNEDKRANSPISIAHESMDPQTSCSSAKPCANTSEQVEAGTAISSSDKCFGFSCVDDAQRDTEISTCDNDLDVNDYQNMEMNKDFVAIVPKLEESSVVSNSTQIRLNITHCNTEPSIVDPPMKASYECPVDNIQENQDEESRTDECLLNCESQNSVEIVTNITQRGGTTDTKIIGQGCNPVACNTTGKEPKPRLCSPQHREEFISDCEKLQVQQSDKSSSQGISTPTADITTVHSLPNPAPTTTAAIATAIPALSKREVGARGGDLLPPVNSEFLSELERADDRDKVATAEESLDLGEGEEDEFGAFLQAGAEPDWTAGFTGEDYNSGEVQRCADANVPASFKSDWTALQPSESTWIAFSQESVEQKITHDGQWWPSTLDKPNLSSVHDVSNVFLDAFPSEKPSCEDPDYIPTLSQLMQGPENGNTEDHREQNLLDGLQDLDRIGLKYERAELLSCKLLLQSLHLDRPTSDCVTVRVKTGARFSPNLPTSNQQLAASAKRRLSYDFNRNTMT